MNVDRIGGKTALILTIRGTTVAQAFRYAGQVKLVQRFFFYFPDKNESVPIEYPDLTALYTELRKGNDGIRIVLS